MKLYSPHENAVQQRFDGVEYTLPPNAVIDVPAEAGAHILRKLDTSGVREVGAGAQLEDVILDAEQAHAAWLAARTKTPGALDARTKAAFIRDHEPHHTEQALESGLDAIEKRRVARSAKAPEGEPA